MFITLKIREKGRTLQFLGIFFDNTVHVVHEDVVLAFVMAIVGHAGYPGAAGQVCNADRVVILGLHKLEQCVHNAVFGKFLRGRCGFHEQKLLFVTV